MPAVMTMRWTPMQWKVVCATFRVFERQIGSRSLQYVSVQGVAAAAGVSTTTARIVLDRLWMNGMFHRVGDGSRMYQPSIRWRRKR